MECDGPLLDSGCLDCDNGRAEQEETEDRLVDGSSDDLEELKEAEKVQARTLYRHHENLATVRDKIAMMEVDRGQLSSALRRLWLGVEYTRTRYGEGSIELGHELLKLSDVLLAKLQSEGGDQVELSAVLREALTIFSTQHGSDSRNCMEIKQKLDFLGANQS